MKSLIKLALHLKNYKWNLLLNGICNVLMVVFSVISIPAIIPFLNILLGQQPILQEAPSNRLNLDNINEYVNYWLSNVILEHGNRTALMVACGFIVSLYFFKNLFRYLGEFFLAPVRNGVVRDLRQELFEKILVLPLSFFSEERKGDLLSRMSADTQEVESSILNVLVTVVREPLLIAGAFGFMIYLNSSMTLVVTGLLLFTGLIIGQIGKFLKRQSNVVQEKLGLLVSLTEEAISGLRIVKGFNAENYLSDRFKLENNKYYQTLVRLLWRKELSSPMTEFLGVATVAVLIWIGYGEVVAGHLTVATFFAMLYAFFSMIEPAKKLSSAWYNIQKGMASLDRIDSVLMAKVVITEEPNPIPLKSFNHVIQYEHVYFHYQDPRLPTLSDINLTIEKGKMIALVGPSGSGKTTLVDLLPRFYDVTSGRILIDGVDIRKASLSDLRSLMGIVSQEPVLFNDTIYNNIAFGLSAVTKEEVEHAARIANAHDFIMQTPDGYQTLIGDRGLKLSGGQRQRLTIARAVLRNPAILILDEATSNLDSESEKQVQEALDNLMSGRTTIVIAHRLSTVQHADLIVVLKEGRVVESGNHKTLLQIKGEYERLVGMQSL